MRVHFVRLTDADFTKDGDVFSSPTIDLYDNEAYRNYSVTRSGYGLDSLGNGVWTGLKLLEPGVTDTGLLRDGRYIDTSGRVDMVSWQVDVTMTTGEGPVTAWLRPYTAVDADAVWPDEYVPGLFYEPSHELNIIDAPRWVRFELHTFPPEGAQFTFEVFIRVEIDPPIMAPKYRSTQRMLDMFPQWMAMREYEATLPATPELATPTSVGGAVLNAFAGQWIDEVRDKLPYVQLQTHIESADLNMVSWVWETTRVPQYTWSVAGDGTPLAHAYDPNEFFTTGADEDVYWWDETDDIVYTRKLYDELLINGTVVVQSPRLVWGPLDDIGLTVDLKRLHLENNDSFQKRILDVYRNRPGVGLEGFKLALRRELNIWRAFGATPDSAYLGATPEILEIADIENDPLYMQPDGMPTSKFTGFVDRLSDDYPITWGKFLWDRAYWDIGGPNHEGFSVLPYRFDATPLTLDDVQPGIGDGDDLRLLRPDVITGPHDFTARLKLRGRQKTERDEYPTVEFDADIYGRWDRKRYSNPENQVWLTVEIVTTDVTPQTYFHSFRLNATSDVNVDRPVPSPASYGTFRYLDVDGRGTDNALIFSSKVDGSDYPGTTQYPDRILLTDISSVTLHHGKWDIGSQAYILKETGDTFEAWFSHAPGSVLAWNGGAPTVTGGANMSLSPVVMMSKQTAYIVEKFTSDRFTHHFMVNGAVPPVGPAPVTVAIPPIVWDPYEEPTPNRQIVVEIKTRDLDGVPGAGTIDEAGAPVFLPYSYLAVDGNATWAEEGSSPPVRLKALPGNTTTFTLSVNTGALYPITATVWEYYEADQITPFEGVVDQNGPWRNGQPPLPGNTNYTLRIMTVDRADFGVPETDDIVLTAMSVEVLDDPRVILTLDNNTINPAVASAGNAEPNPGGINESFASGVYSFEPFMVRARLRTGASPEWSPYIHSGWYHQAGREGYIYAEPVTETITGASHVLAGLNRQGAPIIVRTDEATPREMRQVAFFDATPSLTVSHTETVNGTGINKLYLAYDDVYDVSVLDVATGQAVPAATATISNELMTNDPTVQDRSYTVAYTLTRSFYANNDYVQNDGTLRTHLVFDRPPGALGVSGYKVTYEGSRFDPATPVDLPLSPLFTSFNEGYVFLSHNEYTLDRVEVSISPSKIVADGKDYLLVSMRSLDRYGNPKPNQSFTLSTTFGVLSDPTVTTDKDGFVTVILTAGGGATPPSTGTLTVTGAVNASLTFGIEPVTTPGVRVLAIPKTEQMPANGQGTNLIYGRVEDADFAGQGGVTIKWRRARSLRELFMGDPPGPYQPPPRLTYSFVDGDEIITGATPNAEPFAGTVVADATGSFTVGPFTASIPDEPGYWFVVVETADGAAGDVVFWFEYPDTLYGVEPFTRQPRRTVQEGRPPSSYLPHATVNTFPSYYDEATPYANTVSVYPGSINWLPPLWYAMPKYRQYQLGLLGNTRGQVTYDPAKVRQFRKVI